MSAVRQSGKLFYGVIVVAAAHVVLLVSFGILYSYGAFFESLKSEFHIDRGTTSLIFSVASFGVKNSMTSSPCPASVSPSAAWIDGQNSPVRRPS